MDAAECDDYLSESRLRLADGQACPGEGETVKDPHDPREFRRWLTFALDGSVAAVHEFAAQQEQPLPAVIETTVIADFRTVKIDPALVATCEQKRLECAQAFGAATVAKAAVDAATKAIQQAVEDATRPKEKK